MTISKDEAARALGEIDQARGRLNEATAYGHASPFLIVWGVVWLVADALTQFAPRFGLAWPVCVTTGMVVSIAIGVALGAKRPRPQQTGAGWREAATWVATMLMVFSLFLVVPVTSQREVHSVFGLIFGFIYVIVGLWLGWRMAALGAALVALTLVGFYLVHGWYALFMGVVAGGALIVGGFWLRKL
jgi:hypothetical protein